MAGDKSIDINWYTKRALLGSLYTSTGIAIGWIGGGEEGGRRENDWGVEGREEGGRREKDWGDEKEGRREREREREKEREVWYIHVRWPLKLIQIS